MSLILFVIFSHYINMEWIILGITFYAIWLCDKISKDLIEKDHKAIFDILKPFPISYIDQNLKGGMGIVLDDVVAGIFAAIISTLLMNLIFV